MAISLWQELLQKFQEGLENSIEKISERDIDTIPGAKERLIEKLEQIKRYLPRNDGEYIIKIIDDSIQKSFFPRINNISEAFIKILDARTPEQDYIIQELINGFISSEGKVIASSKGGPILDNLVEAFKKRRDFKIVDFQYYAMFGNPNKPRKYVINRLKKIVEFLGLESDCYVKTDVGTGEDKEITYFSFPKEINQILEGRYIETLETGETYVTDKFDKMVFIAFFLAKVSVERKTLDKFKINGICAIFALIMIISFMPKLQIDEKNPINRDPHFDAQSMSVIPKSWMNSDILSELLPPLIQVMAFRLGGNDWLDKIELTEKKIKLHLQAQFLLKDVNKWVLGNMCRVEIPIFIEISAILNEITVGMERERN
ncbi:MAG: hypothetical protein GF364_17085 [Candidatus Lokiarchaeota archaeon]|nr:hypothetical protein [Candidatus Lokiarchaeota archaeon]